MSEENGGVEEELEGIEDEERRKQLSYIPSDRGPLEVGGMGYDNEWVRLLDKLSKDSSLKELVNYLKDVELTPRAKGKLRMHITVLLDPEFAVSKIRDQSDYWKVLDEKNILDADLCLGLTRFDITPEFIHICDLVNNKWQIKILRSFGGFERTIMATQRTENVSEERVRNAPKKGVKETIMNLWR